VEPPGVVSVTIGVGVVSDVPGEVVGVVAGVVVGVVVVVVEGSTVLGLVLPGRGLSPQSTRSS